MHRYLLLAVVLFAVACEGPTGPQGEIGLQGETGPPKEGVIIERQLSRYLYDENGNISIKDDRITPTTFRAIYLKVTLEVDPDTIIAYAPLDYLLVSALSKELETPSLTILITKGMLLIIDPQKGSYLPREQPFLRG